MTSKELVDGGGKIMKVFEIEGRLYPRFPMESLNNAFNFKARPDDVLLCAYSKSGTHWGYEVVRLLRAGTTDLPLVTKEIGMIDRAAPSSLEEAPSPRDLNSHFHFETLSPEFFIQKCKIIYITRCPRDTMVSYFIHKKNLSAYEGEWKDYVLMHLQGQVSYGSWFDYTKGWEKGMREIPDHPFLTLTFEDMKKNQFKEVKRIADFLGVDYSDDFLKEVVEKTTFQSMKARVPCDNTQLQGMYRKGEIGDWKNWFTVAQSELFNEVFEKEMPGTNAYKLYSQTVQCQADSHTNAA